MAVLGGKAFINDAKGLFDFCVNHVTKRPLVDNECMHFQRKFFYADTIDRDRGFASIKLRTLKGTRQVHSVKCIKPGCIATRNLSCFCASCTGTQDCACQNGDYVNNRKESSVCDVATKLSPNAKGMAFTYYNFFKYSNK